MKYILAVLLLLSSLVQAQSTTDNLITSSGWTGQTYSGNIGGANPVTVLGCCTGYGAYLDTSPTNGGITFSYSSRTVSQAIAINQALSGTGIQLSGYTYSWQYLNQDYNGGTLTGNINLKSNTGSTLGSWNYSMPTTTDWTTMSGTQNFSSNYALANVSNLNVSFTGRDNRFWGGFYGPRVRNIDVRLNYTNDPCADPLSSSSCPGYAAALLTQQCSISALYDPSCPNYATAYLTQQCSINALYSSSCPGYAAAYYTQQCSLNALYDSGCPGYAAAYKTQQCNLNGLYATDCPNYNEAYAKKNILGIGSTTTTTTTSTTTVSTTEPTVQVRSDGKVDASSVPLVSDSNVNSVITSTTTSAAPSATAAVPLVSTTPQQGVQNANLQTSTQTAAPASNSRQEAPASGNTRSAETKTDSKTNQQQMKANATEKAKEEMKKASTAPTMEAQIATQGVVLGMMSFVPGFDSYQTATIVDINALRLQRLYGKDVVENRFVNRRLFGGSDRLHQEMVEQQYQLGR